MLRVVARTLGKGMRQAQPQRVLSASAASVAAETKSVKIPTAVFGPAGKYASALYVVGVRSNVLEEVEGEVRELAAMTESSKSFNLFLRDPSVNKEMRIKAIQEILGEAEFSPITKNFIAVLSENGRLSDLPKISSTFAEILMAHRGQVKGTVTAAMELEADEVAEVKEALQAFLEPGQTLELSQKVDPSIIGGLRVDIGDKHIDLSIRSKIKQLENILSEAL